MSSNKEEVLKVLEKLDEESIDQLVDLLGTMQLMKGYLTDQMVADLARILTSIFKVVNSISNSDLVDIIERAMQDPSLDKALLNPPKLGLLGLLGALRDPEVQRGMGIMISLVKALGKASES
jgi:uncharacterized protein YjgD (DUF1641 family)